MHVMSSPREQSGSRCARFITLLFCAILLSVTLCQTVVGQPIRGGAGRSRPLYRIEVEDASEAALIEQELKVKPELLQGRSFYYYGDESINKRLLALDYRPSPVDPDDIFTRLVRVERRGTEAALRDIGVTIVLRERSYWVVRGTRKQLRVVARSGYRVQELGRREPRPRQVRLVVSTPAQVDEVGALRVDIYDVQRTPAGYVIHGGAFDDAIDDLRARRFVVQILPDPPGVIR